jgi:hypothetical protein
MREVEFLRMMLVSAAIRAEMILIDRARVRVSSIFRPFSMSKGQTPISISKVCVTAYFTWPSV